jgi:endo-1,4-beta-xylanase
LRTDAIYSQLLAQEYNLTEPGFETRFDRVRPSRAEFKFAESDAVIDFANANGMKVIGHPLVPPYAIPEWLTKGNFPPSEISAILKEYIQAMLRRYRGRIYSWDAATAIFDNLGAVSETFWSKAIGPDYIEQVLGWAREADPQVKLFLHDYNYSFAPRGGSSDAIYDLIRKLRARGTPVDGITMGLTLLLDRLPKLEDVATNMKRLAALGLELHVEHFEMSVPLAPSDQDLQRQAAAYRDYLDTCLLNTSCKAFLIWGLTDKDSSIGTTNRWPGMNVGAAMPFDAAYKPKPAYKAMLDALNDRRVDLR